MDPRTALVVDDSKSARFALRKSLERHGFQVATAESARDAYLHLQQHLPDVIFLDHAMPEEDGFAALRRLREQPQTAAIPVVICSSYDDARFVEQARERGAVAVLPKPPTPEALQGVLDELPELATAAPEPPVQATVTDAGIELDTQDPGHSATSAPAEPESPEAEGDSSSDDDAVSNQRLERAMTDLRLHIDAIHSSPASSHSADDRDFARLNARVDELDRRVSSALATQATAHRQAIEQLQLEHAEAMESLRRHQTDALEQVRRQAERDLAALQAQLTEQIDAAMTMARDQAYARVASALRNAFPPAE
ncbi:response regulator [Sinimarinibacterium sp. CAU 1509]|uniref:response regulator n=1 Tax=Sinimarinibacterium sp. CAU 1509 TaxID=2562283 RepID=UPI0010AD84BB|nr:response regulator [Sinimarinibacterium sp. CAU 1509]TJY63128.1 response regulator [Sinimarinibacterium sp. CAU 1509]